VTRRRGRPSKIDRDRIVEVGAAQGLDGLSMQAVAEELGVSVGALYGHVASRAELAQLVAARLRVEVECRTGKAADWRDWLRQFALVVRADLGGSVATLLGAADDKPLGIEVGEPGLELLIDAGLTPVEAAHALWLAVRLSATAGTADAPSFSAFLEPTRRIVDREGRDRYPSLACVHDHLVEGDAPDSFPFDLELVIEGITARLQARQGGDR
jgi:AcrR family transcriptional regulator